MTAQKGGSTRVRQHTRKLKSGRHVVVRSHQRDTLGHRLTELLNRSHRTPAPYRMIASRRRAWGRLVRAHKFMRRNRGGAGMVLAASAIIELILWLLFRGTGVIFGIVAIVLSTVAAFGLSRSMFDAPRYGGSHRSKGKYDD